LWFDEYLGFFGRKGYFYSVYFEHLWHIDEIFDLDESYLILD
jgi:hypothetical protein